MDFAVNGTPPHGRSEVKLSAPGRVKVAVTAAANLDVHGNALRLLRYDEKPCWDIERARIGTSREVPVELIVNGQRAAVQNLAADGKIRTLSFDVAIEQSSWVAMRCRQPTPTRSSSSLEASRCALRHGVVSRRGQSCWTQKAARIFGAGGRARCLRPRARRVEEDR